MTATSGSVSVLAVSPELPGPDSDTSGVFVLDQLVGLQRHHPVVAVHPRSDFGPRPRRWLRRTYWSYRADERRWTDDGRLPVRRIRYRAPASVSGDVVPSMAAAVLTSLDAMPVDVDVVYGHWLWPGGAVALLVARALGVPVAAIARGGDLHGWLDRPHVRPHVATVIGDVDLLLANSEFLRREMDRFVPGSSGRCEVVYNGVDTTEFSPVPEAEREAIRRRLGVGADERVVLCVGPIGERKGHLELAAVWPALAARHPRWTLVLVGPPAESHVVARISRAPAVRIVGGVSRPTVTAWQRAADLVVQPSRSEGLANATLEALAVGRAVVSTDTSGQPEVVIDGVTGALVTTGDTAALAAALDRLMADPDERRRLGEGARRLAVEQFDAPTQQRRLATLLGTLAEGSGR